MDRGANGGVAGGNMRPISWTNRMVDLNGADKHTVQELQIRTFSAVTESECGPIIAVFPQMAYIPDGKTIISCPQVEHYKNTVNKKSPHVTGKTPCIVTLEGYRIPITVRNGLPYIPMRPYMDQEWETLPRVQLTGEKDWDPTILDNPVPKEWYERQPKELNSLRDDLLDQNGNYKDIEGGEKATDNGIAEEGGVEDDNPTRERETHLVSRKEIKTYLHNMVRDECNEEFMYYIADN